MPASHKESLNLDLCLYFSNTLDWHSSDNPIEKLNGYSDLIHWGLHKGTLDKQSSYLLARKSKVNPRKANQVLEKARDLRESIYRIFSASSHDLKPQSGDFGLLNQIVSEAMSNLELGSPKQKSSYHRQFFWRWKKGNEGNLEQVLWPIAKSAADLLVSDELPFVRECANEIEGCGWLFIDKSKNHSRKWCSMSDCGNRSKVRSYYERRKDSLRGT